MKSPCKECPFRKNSAPGWLGAGTGNPLKFLQIMETIPIPCHSTIAEEDWEDERLVKAMGWSHTCIGSLQFMRNTCKLPYDTKYAAIRNAEKTNSEVFEIHQDFIDHHQM